MKQSLKYLFFLILLAAAFTSCQKEIVPFDDTSDLFQVEDRAGGGDDLDMDDDTDDSISSGDVGTDDDDDVEDGDDGINDGDGDDEDDEGGEHRAASN